MDCFHPKYKVNDVADPDDGQNDTGHQHIRPHHHEKSDPHHQCHRDDDSQLSLHRHPLFLYKGFQVLFVKPGAYKPVVEFLGGVGKAEQKKKKKWDGRKNRNHYTDTTQSQAKKTKNQKYQPL